MNSLYIYTLKKLDFHSHMSTECIFLEKANELRVHGHLLNDIKMTGNIVQLLQCGKVCI